MLFLCSAGALLFFYVEDQETVKEFSALQDIVAQTTQDTEVVAGAGQESTQREEQPASQSGEVDKISNSGVLELKKINEDCMGWINIPNTSVNYPVMQSVYEANYYLHRDFYKKYSSYGVPYIDDRFEFGVSDNMVVYGHAMENDTMFSALGNYREYSFYQEHSRILFTDEVCTTGYDIWGVFEINIAEDSFSYHNYIDLNQDFHTEFVENVKKRSFYQTGITPSFGDELITLSTCVNSSPDTRLVVVGVKSAS